MAMKPCKECGQEISSGAKNCPSCGKDQRNWFAQHKIITGLLVIIALGVIGSLGGDDSANTPSTTVNKPTASQPQETQQPKAAPMVVTVDKLMADLESNALNASNTYKGKYVQVTGNLKVIDSGGKYFALYPNKDFAITGVRCDISQEQSAAVAKFTMGQQVTVTGNITDVGEILGYSLKVESIK